MSKDNFGDNLYFDIAIHDEIPYAKYIWSSISLQAMTEEVKDSHYFEQLNEKISERLDRLIVQEERTLEEFKRDSHRKRFGIFAFLLADRYQEMSYYQIGKQQEIVVFLHTARKTFIEVTR